VLILDALERLEEREGGAELTWLPPDLPEGVRLVVSSLPGRALRVIEQRGIERLEVGPISVADRSELITRYLALFAKSLAPKQTQRIAGASACAQPLYLMALLEELRLHGRHETLDEKLQHYLAASTPVELYDRILERFEQDYETNRPGLVRDAMVMLWAARHGLSEPELLDLLGEQGRPLPMAFWSPLRLAAESSLYSRNGLLDFFHDFLREAVRARYLPTAEDQRAAHRRLERYFATREIASRRLDEQAWQLVQAEAWADLQKLLRDPAFIEPALRHDPYGTRAHWAALERYTGAEMPHVYRDLLANPARNIDASWSVASLLHDAGHLEDALVLREAVVEALRRAGDHDLEQALSNLSDTLRVAGKLDRALELLEEQEALCRRSGNAHGLRLAVGNQAIIHQARGDGTRALDLYREEAWLCRMIEDRSGLSKALGGQASVLLSRREYDEARVLLDEQERTCRDEGDVFGLVTALGNQALVHKSVGEIETALNLRKEEARLCRRIGNRPALGTSLGNQAELWIQSGKPERATRLIDECRRIAHETGARGLEQYCLWLEGSVLLGHGALEKAWQCFERQEGICRELGLRSMLETALSGQARVLQGKGAYAEALTRLKEQETICRETDNVPSLLICLLSLGSVRLHLDDLEGAQIALREAERLARKTGDERALQGSLGNRAVVHERRGEIREALALLRDQEAICNRVGPPEDLAKCLHNQGLLLARELGQPVEALSRVEKALEQAREHDLADLAERIAPLLSQLRSDPLSFVGRTRKHSPAHAPAEDQPLLEADPLPPARMALLHLDPEQLAQVGAALDREPSIVVRFDGSGREVPCHLTGEDHRWAESLAPLQDRAQAEASIGNLEGVVAAYREGLRRAPGSDLFLMSLGVAYLQLGEVERGLRFLERAAEISPRNERIRANLDRARAIQEHRDAYA